MRGLYPSFFYAIIREKRNMWSPVWIWESDIPSNICDQIVDCSHKIQYEDGLTQGRDEGRNVNIKFLYEEYNWINALMCGYAQYANCKNFKYELSKCDMEGVQLSRYQVGQYYNKHVDFNGDLWFEGENYTSISSIKIGAVKKKQVIGKAFLNISKLGVKWL